MLDKIGNTGRTDLYGLGELDKSTKAEKAPETKTEAAAIRGNGEAAVSGPKHYQLDGPKAPAIGDQARVVEKLMSALAPTVNLLMQTTEKALNGEQVIKSPSEVVSQSLSLLTLLYQVSKLSREQQVLQREIAVEANVASLKSQAEELNNSAKAMIAMAVISGVLAGITAIVGVVSSMKAGKYIKQEAAGSAIAANKFQKQMATNNTVNTVIQSIGQMANSAANVEQTKAQARSKEDEILATRAQASKQKADENVGFQEGLLKELRELFRSISDSQNQAWRASIPTV
ncbi:type III secretion system translocon subunit SctB (plasmid) [Photobacterium damselae subsp. piscicida]|uniref:Type III secretion system translocon subunit SctB n=1 Tax=Photobacterium damsela subsp. piscicida TaxID=38294 RepID=A0A1V1VGC7_PHODP|nr:type III secretion system translocon subunit VopD [Photobacterium damselae]MBE8130531.1 type III secretion system translocon subunit SctB [Photobacterium damselae subsp. piscicida]MBE8130584.1 type III secretion system translocon subunit SctB [Photobacterium damselae subsp. piscicida]MDP2534139.1 type III secretion system translocon subunit SctB [Photobacterium damselae subsp. piscicida]QOD55151.1 type III secretion system translocon subunit SctB [Photobacterium damselae subsp. piscicida]QO